MRTVDFHCDVLSKLLMDQTLGFTTADSKGKLDVTYERLRNAGSVLQTFAIYIPRHVNGSMGPILDAVDLFYEKILICEHMQPVRSARELEECMMNGKTGALLSLEGVDGLGGSLSALRLLHRLGLRAAGLTWNDANWAADGIQEPRGGGLTGAGVAFVRECNRLGVLIDVSHLSEQAFWDTVHVSERPVIASHSNARSLCPHPRNLTDEQIVALIGQNGLIGVTFVPQFISERPNPGIDDLLGHIDHICALGGKDFVMLGSDFDGIDRYTAGLSQPEHVWSLRNHLLRQYSEAQTDAFLSGNAIRFLRAHLPSH